MVVMLMSTRVLSTREDRRRLGKWLATSRKFNKIPRDEVVGWPRWCFAVTLTTDYKKCNLAVSSACITIRTVMESTGGTWQSPSLFPSVSAEAHWSRQRNKPLTPGDGFRGMLL